MNRTDADRLDIYCPECGILVEARVAAEACGPATEDAVTGFRGLGEVYYFSRFAILFCSRCNGPFLVERSFREIVGEHCEEEQHRVLYPGEAGIQLEGLPTVIEKSYLEALGTYRSGHYESCAIMCRKCLEAVCRELGTVKGNLKQRLTALQSSGKIDAKLSNWADALRVVGNDAAHDLDARVGQQDAKDALDFTQAILLYAFSLGRKFEEFKARRAPSRDKGGVAGDAN